MDIQTAMTEQFQVDTDEHPSTVHDFSEDMKAAYKDILGHSRVEMRLTTDGLHIDNSMTFK